MNQILISAKYGAIICVIAIGLCFSCQPASANELPDAIAKTMTQKKYATVWRISGRVTASHNGVGKERLLQEDDAVYTGDFLKADASGEATLKTEDAGAIAIRPNTEFLAETYSAEGNETDNFSVRLMKGSLRMISGWISQTNRGGMKIITHTATIGLRGTDHEPYVLTAEMALGTANKEGTYDKVNRGGTTLKVGEVGLDIDVGKVGFAREANKDIAGRALMTLLLPVLLDKVPSFYVPGKFDADLDRYSETADRISQAKLDYKLKRSNAPLATECIPEKIAKAWLSQLDLAISQKDSHLILSLFAPDGAVRATVRDKDGTMTSIDLKREEFVQSTIQSMQELKDYKQRRVSLEAKLATAPASPTCTRISLQSGVIEEGYQSGKPYRFESVEEYLLELQNGKWLSIKAETTQQ